MTTPSAVRDVRGWLNPAVLGRAEVWPLSCNKPAFVLFDVGKEGWRGATAFAPDRVNYLENQRGGTLAFRRYD